MNELIEWIPFLIPIILIQLALMIFALVDLNRREHIRGEKWMWVLVIIFVNIVGPVVYLIMGRED